MRYFSSGFDDKLYRNEFSSNVWCNVDVRYESNNRILRCCCLYVGFYANFHRSILFVRNARSRALSFGSKTYRGLFFSNRKKKNVTFLQNFLLLDESERDNRLFSTSFQQLHHHQSQIVDDATKKSSTQLICHLKDAHWNQVTLFNVEEFDSHRTFLERNICIEEYFL